jgi:nucleotide-binding universal stress UspA family protein
MYKKVLVPVDGSGLAESTLDYVKALTKEGSVGEVTLLNVVKLKFPWPVMGSEEKYPKSFDVNTFRDTLFTASRKYLADMGSRLTSEGIKVNTASLEGSNPADIIAQYAQEKGMDVIIMGTHGYTGLKKLMFGNVASDVLHNSHIPALLIRPLLKDKRPSRRFFMERPINPLLSSR